MKVDIICSCCWTPLELFELNLQSWLEEFPVNRIILGIGREELRKGLTQLAEKYECIILVDQVKYTTSGICFINLMSYVETEWFLFIHDDVKPLPKITNVIFEFIDDKVGIIESAHLNWDGIISDKDLIYPKYKAHMFYHDDRAYSGLQLIRKEAMKEIIECAEDDYIMRNEDLIIQYACMKQGFDYMKTWVFHSHQDFPERPRPRLEIYEEWQWRGLIKYTNPEYDFLIREVMGTIYYFQKKNEISLEKVLAFCKINMSWYDVIIKYWDNQKKLMELRK